MLWSSMNHAVVQIVSTWALVNLSAITFFIGLFLVENALEGRLRRRRARSGAMVIPISGR